MVASLALKTYSTGSLQQNLELQVLQYPDSAGVANRAIASFFGL
jgi:hypothetical protein